VPTSLRKILWAVPKGELKKGGHLREKGKGGGGGGKEKSHTPKEGEKTEQRHHIGEREGVLRSRWGDRENFLAVGQEQKRPLRDYPRGGKGKYFDPRKDRSCSRRKKISSLRAEEGLNLKSEEGSISKPSKQGKKRASPKKNKGYPASPPGR